MRPLRYIAAGPVAVLLAALALGCSEPRPWAHDGRGTLAWREDLQPLFADRCASCHAGTAPAGGVDTTSYVSLIGFGSGRQVATAGDPTSPLVKVLASPDANHQAVADLAPAVRQWVVDDKLAYFKSAVHAPGLINPNDPDFHGKLLQSQDWNFGLCQKCHGTDWKGGAANRSCFACHDQAPTDCATCHGPKGLHGKGGSHKMHLEGGALGKKWDCSECHTKPNAWNDVGHLLDANGHAIVQDHAPVSFGALASQQTPDRGAPPSYMPVTTRCDSVYCHGGAFTDSAATNRKPQWDSPGTEQTKCGTCHGLPPSSHKIGDLNCSVCHGLVVDADKHIINTALHLDGKVELGNGTESCSGCHGSAQTPAPPPDLAGSSDPSSVTVGAHLAHLFPTHRLRGPLTCSECHPDVTKIDSPGHIDHAPPAQVFPDANYTGIANADGAQPAWDRDQATCNSVYCHGGGTHLAADASENLFRTPSWVVPTVDAVKCGACHGIPPLDGKQGHEPTAQLSSCVTCHPSTVDATGAIQLTDLPDGGTTSTHINGVIDVVP